VSRKVAAAGGGTLASILVRRLAQHLLRSRERTLRTPG
jgi:hypothetical protein